MNKGNKSKVIFTLTILAAALNTYAQEAKQLGQVTVTARRAEGSSSEVPQKIEVVDQKSIERTTSQDISDILKKNTGVDVIQYPGVLAGIGIRGFRPEFSGLNKRSLLLIDGRPAGATNLAMIMAGNVERIEVLKGPASSLYGSSAMGGVVNIITRESRDAIGGAASASYGSFDSTELGLRTGGKVNSTFDFDYSGGWFDQADDFKMGNGQTRPNTSYERDNHAIRLGFNINPNWRLVTHADTYKAKDVATPGDIAYDQQQQSNKDVDRTGGDIRLTGKVGSHILSWTAYASQESSTNYTKTSSNALDLPFLPYRSFESEIKWRGLQFQDQIQWGKNNLLVTGIDTEVAESESRSYLRTGVQQAPFSADSEKHTTGVYLQNTFLWNQEKTAATIGVRYDRIEVDTVDTPLKTNFTPSSATFNTTNPSLGIKHELNSNLRLHATVGRGFVAPDASQLTGFTSQVDSLGRTTISQGNAGLRPETSVTWDFGTEIHVGQLDGDITYFHTRVKDKITSIRSTTPAPAPVISTYENAGSATMHGLELEFGWNFAKDFRLFTNATRMFSRKERTSVGERDINNVPELTARLGIDIDKGPFSGRIAARYVGERKDDDFVFNLGQIRYDNFTVLDISARYEFNKQHSVNLKIDNATDKFYYEKLGFPLAGRAVYAGYQYKF